MKRGEGDRAEALDARAPAGGTRRSVGVRALCLFALAASGFSQTPDPAEIDRAIASAVTGDYGAALEAFKGELLKQPRDPLLNYYVGITLLRLERLDAAVVHLEKAVGEKAPFPQAFYWLARAYFEQERGEDAEAVLKRGLDRFPGNRDLTALAEELDRGAPTPG